MLTPLCQLCSMVVAKPATRFRVIGKDGLAVCDTHHSAPFPIPPETRNRELLEAGYITDDRLDATVVLLQSDLGTATV